MNPFVFGGPICSDSFCGGLGPIAYLWEVGPYLIAVVLLFLAVRKLSKKRNNQSLLFAGACLLVSALAIGGRYYSTYKEEHHFVNEYQESAKAIDFTVYSPGYLPPGSKTHSIGIYEPVALQDLTVMLPSGTPDVSPNTGYPYVFMEYSTIDLKQFNLAKINLFNGDNCGPDIPEGSDLALYFRGDYKMKCDYLATTTNGFSIYHSQMFKDKYYAVRSNTKISLDCYLGKEQAIKVVENLKPVNPSSLKFINKKSN